MDRYRPPTDAERSRAVATLAAVLAHRVPPPHDLRLTTRRDSRGCPLTVLAYGTNGWGAVVLPPEAELVVEVPHPGADRHTTHLGHALHRAIPAAALLVAGAHRTAGGGSADVAHRADSLFHAFAQTLALPELQLHGFAARSAPHTDVVLTAGAGEPTELHERLAAALARQGFRRRHHDHLAGRTNVQGIAAAACGRPFLHLELAPLLRLRRRDAVVEAVTHAWHQHRHQHAGQRGTRGDQERHPEPRE